MILVRSDSSYLEDIFAFLHSTAIFVANLDSAFLDMPSNHRALCRWAKVPKHERHLDAGLWSWKMASWYTDCFWMTLPPQLPFLGLSKIQKIDLWEVTSNESLWPWSRCLIQRLMDGKRVDDVQSESQGFSSQATILNMVIDQLRFQEFWWYTWIILLHTSYYNIWAIFSAQSIVLFWFNFTNVVGFTLSHRGVDRFPRQLRAMLFNQCSGRDEAWVSAFIHRIGITGVHRQDLTVTLSSIIFPWSIFFCLMSILVSTRLPHYDSIAPLENNQKKNRGAKGDCSQRNGLLIGLELLFFFWGKASLHDRPLQGDTAAILADWLSSTSVGLLKTGREAMGHSTLTQNRLQFKGC